MPQAGSSSKAKGKGKGIAQEPSRGIRIEEPYDSSDDDMPLVTRRRKPLRASLRDPSSGEEAESPPPSPPPPKKSKSTKGGSSTTKKPRKKTPAPPHRAPSPPLPPSPREPSPPPAAVPTTAIVPVVAGDGPLRGPLPSPTPYPFSEPLAFTNAKHVENYERIKAKGKVAIATLYPDMNILGDDVANEVRSKLTYVGFNYVFFDDPGSYQRVVEEFLCSFEEGRNEEDHKVWRFRLGGKDFQIRKDMIRDWLHFPVAFHEISQFTEHQQSRFWKMISGRQEWFAPSYNSSAITTPVWKVIHHIIALGINTRTELARSVSYPDLNLMMEVEFGHKIQWIDVLASRFESFVSKSSRNLSLGGGSLITLIAMGCNFTFGHEGCPKPSKRILDLATMKTMHLLKADGVTWEEDKRPHKGQLQTAARKKRAAFKARNYLYCQANLTPSPPSSPIPSPPAASEPEAPIVEELPTEEPAVESAPPATVDWVEWRERVSSDIADLRNGLASLEAFTRAEALRARQESEWLRTTLSSMIRSTSAPLDAPPVDPGPSAPRAPSPLPTVPSTRPGEAGTPPSGATMERCDSSRETTPGGDDATS